MPHLLLPPVSSKFFLKKLELPNGTQASLLFFSLNGAYSISSWKAKDGDARNFSVSFLGKVEKEVLVDCTYSEIQRSEAMAYLNRFYSFMKQSIDEEEERIYAEHKPQKKQASMIPVKKKVNKYENKKEPNRNRVLFDK